jgi:hypothetical protein
MPSLELFTALSSPPRILLRQVALSPGAGEVGRGCCCKAKLEISGELLQDAMEH